MTVRVIGFKEAVSPDELVVNTTSRSSESWSRGLSPFYLGPVPLYEGAVCAEAANLENAWQFSKVYPEHLDGDRNPTQAYFEWAAAGWRDTKAHRYPMGKGAKPSYSWWAGKRLGYLEARKSIYIPLYARAVVQTHAFAHLLDLYRKTGSVTLWDFDGYDHRSLGMSMKDVVNNEKRSMGHAFVVAHLLESILDKEKP